MASVTANAALQAEMVAQALGHNRVDLNALSPIALDQVITGATYSLTLSNLAGLMSIRQIILGLTVSDGIGNRGLDEGALARLPVGPDPSDFLECLVVSGLPEWNSWPRTSMDAHAEGYDVVKTEQLILSKHRRFFLLSASWQRRSEIVGSCGSIQPYRWINDLHVTEVGPGIPLARLPHDKQGAAAGEILRRFHKAQALTTKSLADRQALSLKRQFEQEAFLDRFGLEKK